MTISLILSSLIFLVYNTFIFLKLYSFLFTRRSFTFTALFLNPHIGKCSCPLPITPLYEGLDI